MHKAKHSDGNLGLLGHIIASVILFGTTIFAFNVVTGGWQQKIDLGVGALIVFFVIAEFGSLWRLRDLIRERAPLVYFLLAAAPYAFVWYYLDRVRMRGHQTR
jgi:hypothetical protein